MTAALWNLPAVNRVWSRISSDVSLLVSVYVCTLQTKRLKSLSTKLGRQLLLGGPYVWTHFADQRSRSQVTKVGVCKRLYRECPLATPRGIAFTFSSVCLWVCLFVCQRGSSWTVWDIIMKGIIRATAWTSSKWLHSNAPVTSTSPHLRCDVGLEEGEYRENCLCLAVLCTIIMVHKYTSSSYRSVDYIGLWSCLV